LSRVEAILLWIVKSIDLLLFEWGLLRFFIIQAFLIILLWLFFDWLRNIFTWIFIVVGLWFIRLLLLFSVIAISKLFILCSLIFINLRTRPFINFLTFTIVETLTLRLSYLIRINGIDLRLIFSNGKFIGQVKHFFVLIPQILYLRNWIIKLFFFIEFILILIINPILV
jgi:hypothetical protein